MPLHGATLHFDEAFSWPRLASMSESDVLAVQRAYPKIYHACHVDHPRRATNVAKLSARETWVLGHLSTDFGMSPLDLATHLGVVPSTLSAVLKRLGTLGYVRRAARSNDRRHVDIFLTDRGAMAIEGASVLDFERLAMVLSGLAPADRKRAVDGLGLLAKAAERAMQAYSKERGIRGCKGAKR